MTAPGMPPARGCPRCGSSLDDTGQLCEHQRQTLDKLLPPEAPAIRPGEQEAVMAARDLVWPWHSDRLAREVVATAYPVIVAAVRADERLATLDEVIELFETFGDWTMWCDVLPRFVLYVTRRQASDRRPDNARCCPMPNL